MNPGKEEGNFSMDVSRCKRNTSIIQLEGWWLKLREQGLFEDNEPLVYGATASSSSFSKSDGFLEAFAKNNLPVDHYIDLLQAIEYYLEDGGTLNDFNLKEMVVVTLLIGIANKQHGLLQGWRLELYHDIHLKMIASIIANIHNLDIIDALGLDDMINLVKTLSSHAPASVEEAKKNVDFNNFIELVVDRCSDEAFNRHHVTTWLAMVHIFNPGHRTNKHKLEEIKVKYLKTFIAWAEKQNNQRLFEGIPRLTWDPLLHICKDASTKKNLLYQFYIPFCRKLINHYNGQGETSGEPLDAVLYQTVMETGHFTKPITSSTNLKDYGLLDDDGNYLVKGSDYCHQTRKVDNPMENTQAILLINDEVNQYNQHFVEKTKKYFTNEIYANIESKCPRCRSDIAKAGHSSDGRQRYKCTSKACSYRIEPSNIYNSIGNEVVPLSKNSISFQEALQKGCPHCSSLDIVKCGFQPPNKKNTKKQIYKCNRCKKTFSKYKNNPTSLLRYQ